MESLIYYAKGVGLANRLRALIGYMAISQYRGIPLYLCWVKDSCCDADFSELFSCSQIQTISESQLSDMSKLSKNITYLDHHWFKTIWSQYVSQEISWESFREMVISSKKNLQLLPWIENMVEEFSISHDLRCIKAVHIRQTDNVHGYKTWSRYSKKFTLDKVSNLSGFEKYFQDTLKKEPLTKFFLATDNQKVEEYFYRLFPDQILTYPKSYSQKSMQMKFSWSKLKFQRQFHRTSSIADALIEMLLLGKCSSIVGTYYSSFSKLAAFWNNVPYFEVNGNEYRNTKFIQSLYGEVPV